LVKVDVISLTARFYQNFCVLPFDVEYCEHFKMKNKDKKENAHLEGIEYLGLVLSNYKKIKATNIGSAY